MTFLGLTAGERNRRLLARAAGSPSGAPAGALAVPDGAIVTREAVAALPRAGAWRLEWHASRDPLIWRAEGSAPDAPLSTASLPDGAVLDVSTPAARLRTTWRLLKASGKPTDGWLSRHVHRRVSRPISFALLQLGVSANVATLLTFAVGLVAAWLLAQISHATMIAGGFLFWFASMADGVDGEIARLRLAESEWGDQLDTIVDDATYVACYAGALIGWWRQGIGAGGWMLVGGTAVALAATVAWATRLVKRAGAAPRGQRLVALTPIELAIKDAARTSGGAGLRAVSAAFQIFRREQFSLALFAVALATGWRGALVAAVAAGLGAALVVLVTWQRDLLQALAARAGSRGRPASAMSTP